MKNTAIVEKVDKEGIVVSYVRRSACGENCTMCNNCNSQKVYTKVTSDFSVNVGNTVVIESKTSSVLCAMFIIFLLPLFLPLILYLLTFNYGKILSTVCVMIGILVSIFIIFFLSRSDGFIKTITPKIVSINNKK